MGVYHLMGLGLSPGAVTGPLSYLAHRYERWNDDDQQFFSRSGESVQRKEKKKVGDVQSIVLFTTQEVINGTVPSFSYVENQPGKIVQAPEQPRKPMKEVLRRLLKNEWENIRGEKPNERPKGSIFWVEVDRRDIGETYKRIIQVIVALAGVGRQGKEMWVNLTGGNNVTNFALQLAATLSGEVARLYYAQAADQAAEKCVRFTAENGYWIELPVMPLNLSSLSLDVIELLEQKGVLDLDNLYSELSGRHWSILTGISSENFREIYLSPMWKQGLIADENGLYKIGSQWELIKPYEEILQQAKNTGLSIEQLAKQESWIEQEEINLR